MEAIVEIVIVGTILLLLVGGFMVSFLIIYKKKQRLNKIEKLQLRQEYDKALLQSQLEIREQTLQHVSRELHDNLGQVASLIKINLNTLNFTDTEKAKAKTEDTKGLVRQLITDLKMLSTSLGSGHLLRTGLPEALRLEAERINKTGVLYVQFKQHHPLPSMDSDTAVILYRISQEILNNSLKHSGATQITIDIQFRENIYILAISDNGTGFLRNELKGQTNAGLANLENRAALINSKLNIESSRGTGTTVTIELPYIIPYANDDYRQAGPG